MSVNKDFSYWVFGYGSLIWKPGFEYVEKQKALLNGAHRCLCIYSHHYRGSKESPGLVFGLMPKGSCYGMAFRVDKKNWDNVFAYLQQREQVSGVYKEKYHQIILDNGEKVTALTYFANSEHEQYAGDIEIENQVKIVTSATGEMGNNLDYVINTADHLSKMGINDENLSKLRTKLSEY